MSIYRLTGSRELNVKAVVAAFNQEKALVGAFSVITNLRMELFEALLRKGDFSVQVRVRLDSSVTFSQLSKLTASRYLKMLSATCQS